MPILSNSQLNVLRAYISDFDNSGIFSDLIEGFDHIILYVFVKFGNSLTIEWYDNSSNTYHTADVYIRKKKPIISHNSKDYIPKYKKVIHKDYTLQYDENLGKDYDPLSIQFKRVEDFDLFDLFRLDGKMSASHLNVGHGWGKFPSFALQFHYKGANIISATVDAPKLYDSDDDEISIDDYHDEKIELSALPISDAKVFEKVRSVLYNPNLRVSPLYRFGNSNVNFEINTVIGRTDDSYYLVEIENNNQTCAGLVINIVIREFHEIEDLWSNLSSTTRFNMICANEGGYDHYTVDKSRFYDFDFYMIRERCLLSLVPRWRYKFTTNSS